MSTPPYHNSPKTGAPRIDAGTKLDKKTKGRLRRSLYLCLILFGAGLVEAISPGLLLKTGEKSTENITSLGHAIKNSIATQKQESPQQKKEKSRTALFSPRKSAQKSIFEVKQPIPYFASPSAFARQTGLLPAGEYPLPNKTHGDWVALRLGQKEVWVKP